MAASTLLDAAAELVRRVLRFDQPADRLVAAFFRDHHGLGARDRPVLADTVYAVLRRLSLFRHLAEEGGGRVERRLAMLGWQGSAELLRGAQSAAEAEWLQQACSADRGRLPAELRHNLPGWIAEPLQAALGSEFWDWVASTDQPAPLDLRVNVAKASRAQVLAQLQSDGVAAAPTPFSPVGLRVAGKPSLQRLAVFDDGRIEVQDEGSQLLALLTGARRGEMVVDFCAGAGGKTLALGAQMRGSGRVYAFDIAAHRLAALAPRLERSGLDNVYPAQIAHEGDDRVRRLEGKVDRVLVDAPCTGLGTLRRNPDLKWRQTPDSLAALGAAQRRILAAAARLLKPGGRLVYATCSPLEQEDEQIAAEFEAAQQGGFVRLPVAELLGRAQVASAASLACGNDLRLWTHRHGTDCFYAAAWQRLPAVTGGAGRRAAGPGPGPTGRADRSAKR